MEKLSKTPLEPLRRFLFLLAITTYLIIQFLLNSIMNSCLGGQSSVRLSPNIIWNNCEIRIDNKPVHYKNYYEAGIVFTQDL